MAVIYVQRYKVVKVGLTSLGQPRQGRDGSPSRPLEVSDSELIRFNGGLGEPSLHKTG